MRPCLRVLDELHIEGIEGVIQSALARGTGLVILDGLDEVSKPAMREQVQDAIRTFIQEHRDQPGNRFLITSRVAGYDQSAFPDYLHYTIAELSDDQIDYFLPRWCRATLRRDRATPAIQEQVDESDVEVERKVKDLKDAIEGNQRVRELAENPLLLTLLVVMQQNSIVLPGSVSSSTAS